MRRNRMSLSNGDVYWEKDGRIFWIVLNRPKSLNAMNEGLLDGINECISLAERDDDVSVVAMRGEGRAFCSGGDLAEFRRAGDNVQSFIDMLAGKLNETVMSIRMARKPVVSVVKGYASGAGFSLSLACDVTLASESSVFNMAYIRVALSPDGGGSLFLSRILGLKKAFHILSTGRNITSREALELGLVTAVFPDDTFDEDVRDFLRGLSEMPSGSLKSIKMLLNSSLFPDLFASLELERRVITELSGTQDFREGLDAFFQRRKPNFGKR